MKKALSMLMVAALCAGCTLARVKVDVVSERTSLENQVLGTYNALDREMLLVASVRGIDTEGRVQPPPRQSREQQDVLLAMQVLSFHEDDLQAFKQLGWVGENKEGLLTVFPMAREKVPKELKEFSDRYKEEEFRSVVGKINAAREVVMRRVIALNENFTEGDLPAVRSVFAKLNAQNAASGEKVQAEDGTWKVKP
jgi:uncharacterized protein YdbL (DUF1318 family)